MKNFIRGYDRKTDELRLEHPLDNGYARLLRAALGVPKDFVDCFPISLKDARSLDLPEPDAVAYFYECSADWDD